MPPPRSTPALLLLLGAAFLLTAAPYMPTHAEDTAHISVRPGSTVLATGTSAITLTVNTSAPTDCRYALDADTAFAAMHPFPQQLSPVLAAANISISPDPRNTTNVFVACAAWPAEAITLAFRALPDTDRTPFPRRGNLWGSWNFEEKGLEYAAAHIDLWLGAGWSPAEIATLRQLNPYTLALTSLNAVEDGDGLPDSFYLHNISGPTSRCEVWPGAFRLDLTRPEVSLYKAQRMFTLVMGLPPSPPTGSAPWPKPSSSSPSPSPSLFSSSSSSSFSSFSPSSPPPTPSLPFDGIFVDNVFLTQSWLTEDIHGNPFYPDTTGTGKPDDPKVFDAKWRAGVLLELRLFRSMMPSALMSGHAMSWQDPDIASIFNGISIGFSVPEVIEGLARFSDVLNTYAGWLTVPAHTPHVTMVESAVFLQVGYGYGFNNQIQAGSIPGPTWDFVRDYYPYMRFGLGLTLLQDGYFCHELGDSDHGQDWWYDELAVNLGLPLSSAQLAHVLDRSEGGSSSPSSSSTRRGAHPAVSLDPSVWQLFVVAGNAAATLSWDTADKHSPSGAAALVNITEASGVSSDVELHGGGFSLAVNQSYALSFWAKASSPREVDVAAMKNSPSWENLGLQQAVLVTETWAEYTASFEAIETQADGGAKFSFFLALANGSVWIDNVTLSVLPPPVYLRAFQQGLVIVNGDTAAHNVSVPDGYRRFQGAQAPRYQYIVDDGDAARFAANESIWSFATYAGGYNFSQPTNEVIPGPYFHHWRLGCHQAVGRVGSGVPLPGAAALFDLAIPTPDTYNLSVWWPAAPTASATWSRATLFEVLDSDGATVLANKTLDQSRTGDTWNSLAILPLRPGAKVAVYCGVSGALCVADAILVESQARYNDGSEVAGSAIELAALDAVVLVSDSATRTDVMREMV